MVAFDIFYSFLRKNFLEDGFIFQLRWLGQKKLCIEGHPPVPERRDPGICGVGGNRFFKNF